MNDQPKHYDYKYRHKLTQMDITTGVVVIKLDPYRIADIYNVGGGAREQILKKALRWDTKGDATETQVIREILQACNRRLEMIEEDEA